MRGAGREGELRRELNQGLTCLMRNPHRLSTVLITHRLVAPVCVSCLLVLDSLTFACGPESDRVATVLKSESDSDSACSCCSSATFSSATRAPGKLAPELLFATVQRVRARVLTLFRCCQQGVVEQLDRQARVREDRPELRHELVDALTPAAPGRHSGR